MKTLKPIVALFLAITLAFGSILAGCTPQGNVNDKNEHPFSFDCDPTGKDVVSFANNDTANMLLASNPFYGGAQPVPGGKAGEYEKARAIKVNEIIKESGRLVKATATAEPKLSEIRKAYLDYLTTALKAEPKLEDFVKKSFSQVITLKSKEQIVKSEFDSVPKTGVSNKFARSMLDYLKATKAVELGGLYLQDVETISKHAALVLETTSKHPNPTVKSANKSLDANMKKLDNMKDDLSNIVVSLEKIGYGFKQLKTGDYYMARETMAFMKKEMSGVKKKAGSLKAGKQLKENDVKFIQAYVNVFEKTQKVLDKQLDSVDKSELIDIKTLQKAMHQGRSNKNGLFTIPSAYAVSEKSDYVSAIASFESPPESKIPEKGYFEQGWSGVKTVVHGAQTAAGYSVDILGAIAGSFSSFSIGIYRGSSASDICDDAAQAWIDVADNYEKDLSGSSTFKAADGYFDEFEKGSGSLAGAAVKSTLGEGWTSWATAAVAKATASMFTGIGKGVVKLANRNADATQITQGLLELGLAFVGGSKSVLKLTQMPGVLQGLKQEGALAGRTGITFMQEAFNGLDKKVVARELQALLTKNELTAKEVAQLINNSIELEARQATIAGLQSMRQSLLQEMKDILKQGGKEALETSRKGIKENLSDLFEKSFAANMSGFKDALLAVTGDDTIKFLENLIATWVDDYLKELVEETMKSIPDASEITGKWKGSITITQILISKNDMPKQGCNLNIDLEKFIGKKTPVTFDFNMIVNNGTSGSGKVRIIGGKPSAPLNVSYDNGKLNFEFYQKGGTGVFTGDVSRTDTGLEINGTMNGNYKGKTMLKATWTATKNLK